MPENLHRHDKEAVARELEDRRITAQAETPGSHRFSGVVAWRGRRSVVPFLATKWYDSLSQVNPAVAVERSLKCSRQKI